jgi:hypothetical protein
VPHESNIDRLSARGRVRKGDRDPSETKKGEDKKESLFHDKLRTLFDKTGSIKRNTHLRSRNAIPEQRCPAFISSAFGS